MAGPRGYTSYRGRGSKWKILLAVLLVLIILGAVAVIFLQRQIVYDSNGTPHLDIPWKTEETEEEPETLPVPDLEIVDPEHEPTAKPEKTQLTLLPEVPLTMAGLQQALETKPDEVSGFAVTLKDSQGRVYFDAASVQGSVNTAADTAEALKELNSQEKITSTAIISCFQDSKAANSDVEGMGLKNTGGYIFYDGNNEQWLDPSKPAARAYLCQLAASAAELGFDEILLTDVSYPTKGKLDKIDYGTERDTALSTFLQELRDALKEYAVTVSIELSPAAIANGSDKTAGQDLSTMAAQVNRIYAPVSPENVENYAAAVTAANQSTVFVPIQSVLGAADNSWLYKK